MGELWKFMYYGLHLDSIHVMLYWNFEYAKAVTLHCAEVGGDKDQGPTIQVTHLRLNQPFSFCSDV